MVCMVTMMTRLINDDDDCFLHDGVYYDSYVDVDDDDEYDYVHVDV